MSEFPDFQVNFLHFSRGVKIPFDREALNRPIPLARPEDGFHGDSGITYGAYLRAIERFVRTKRDTLWNALTEQSQGLARGIDRVDIVAEKHGSDYHPARVVVHSGEWARHFVVNVAVTPRGVSRMAREFATIKRLHDRHALKFVPRPYCMEEGPLGEGGEAGYLASMFLAQWIEGFHEFHLSGHGEAEAPTLVLWDLDRGYSFLSRSQEHEIYRQAAFILTYYYDPGTYEEIYPWHHAAGDFVAGWADGSLEVKLIAVRQYDPRVVFRHESPDNRLDAMLLFLANLTVRMRLDRLDGVGETSWAGEHCITATMSGFLDGLETKVQEGTCWPDLAQQVTRRVRSMPVAEWADLFGMVMNSYSEESPDSAVVREHIADHVYQVYSTVGRHLPWDTGTLDRGAK